MAPAYLTRERLEHPTMAARGPLFARVRAGETAYARELEPFAPFYAENGWQRLRHVFRKKPKLADSAQWDQAVTDVTEIARALQMESPGQYLPSPVHEISMIAETGRLVGAFGALAAAGYAASRFVDSEKIERMIKGPSVLLGITGAVIGLHFFLAALSHVGNRERYAALADCARRVDSAIRELYGP